jgi:hypothetical protein
LVRGEGDDFAKELDMLYQLLPKLRRVSPWHITNSLPKTFRHDERGNFNREPSLIRSLIQNASGSRWMQR